jgi:MFS family permease
LSAVVLLAHPKTSQANLTIVYTYFDLAPQGEQGYTYTTNIIGALNGVNSAGAIIGCIISAWAADAYSRKRTIQLGCVILVVGGAICTSSVTIGMFLAGRVIAGIGSGILAGECCLVLKNEHLLRSNHQWLSPCIRARFRLLRPVAP